MVERIRRRPAWVNGPAFLPWIHRRAAELLATRDLRPVLAGLDADEVEAILAMAAEVAPHRGVRT